MSRKIPPDTVGFYIMARDNNLRMYLRDKPTLWERLENRVTLGWIWKDHAKTKGMATKTA